MIGGRLLRGKHFQAGVLGGHLVADFDGRPCTCGSVGCVEAEASTWALPEIVPGRPGLRGERPRAARARLDFEALFACADAGDAVAAAVRDRCLRVWAAGAVAMVHAWDPEVLVVGGGVMRRAGRGAAGDRGARPPRTPGRRGARCGPGGGARRRAPRCSARCRCCRGREWSRWPPQQLRQGALRRRSGPASACEVGWAAIVERLRALRRAPAACWRWSATPASTWTRCARRSADGLRPALVVDARQAYKDAAEIERMCAPFLGDDPVFGRMNGLSLADFLDAGAAPGPARADRRGAQRASCSWSGRAATLVRRAGRARLRGPRALGDPAAAAAARGRRAWAAHDQQERPAKLYKRGFFVDWRAADRLKRTLLERIDWLLDTNDAGRAEAGRRRRLPRAASRPTARGPFRVVPFFDPGPWGGQWMKEVCDLPARRAELRLVLRLRARGEQPAARLRRHARRGAGASTSSSATRASCSARRSTPASATSSRSASTSSTRWAAATSRSRCTRSPSTSRTASGCTTRRTRATTCSTPGEGACVYLGVKDGVDREAMVRRPAPGAGAAGLRFPDERYVNRWPAKKHDHFLIPGGTVHCSGRDAMVLEISATPYIFTFKLWDWDRLGLDGRPRPIHIDHGASNIQWDRTTAWVERELVNRVEPLGAGRRLARGADRAARARVHRDAAALVHGPGAARHRRRRERAEPRRGRGGGGGEPGRGLRAVRRPLRRDVHRPRRPWAPTRSGRTGRRRGRECATIKAFVRTRP